MCVPRVLLCISEVDGQQGVTGEAEAAHGERSPQTEAHHGGQTGHRRGFRERWRGQVDHCRYSRDILLLFLESKYINISRSLY